MNTVCTHIVHHTKKRLDYYSGNYDSFVKTREEKNEEQEKRFKNEQDQIQHMKNYVAKFGQGTPACVLCVCVPFRSLCLLILPMNFNIYF